MTSRPELTWSPDDSSICNDEAEDGVSFGTQHISVTFGSGFLVFSIIIKEGEFIEHQLCARKYHWIFS